MPGRLCLEELYCFSDFCREKPGLTNKITDCSFLKNTISGLNMDASSNTLFPVAKAMRKGVFCNEQYRVQVEEINFSLFRMFTTSSSDH